MGTITFVDGFDETSTHTPHGWSANFSVDTGRIAGQSMSATNSSSYHLLPSDARYTFEFAYKLSTPTVAAYVVLFREGTTSQGFLRYNGNGTFSVQRGDGTTLTNGTTADLGILAATWYHIGLDYAIHDSTGAFELRINGVNRASNSGLDTRNGGTSGVCDNIYMTISGGQGQHWWDDLVCTKGGGFQGDCRIITQLPNAAGALSEWDYTGSGVTANYQAVDDATSFDSDTTYVSTSTVGERDTYGFPDLGVLGTVKAVALSFVARTDDATARKVAPVIRTAGGTNYDGTAVDLVTTYAGNQQVYETDPSTSAAWTISNIDSHEFGIKLDT